MIVGGGEDGAAVVDGARLGGDRLEYLSGTARVLARAGIVHNSVMENVVRSGIFAPTFEPDTKGGLATMTPVGWWTECNLGPPPGA